jgi:hypothetical protein
MITDESSKPEIRDLQRLLISPGHLEWTIDGEGGKSGKETLKAVVAASADLGWEHPRDGRWVTAGAPAARPTSTGGAGSSAGGVGRGLGPCAGGAGSDAGGAGSYAGESGRPE